MFLKLGLDDLPNEARGIASQVSGGIENASFGNEEALDSLVEEMSNWMLGKGPSESRSPRKGIAGLIDAVIEE